MRSCLRSASECQCVLRMHDPERVFRDGPPAGLLPSHLPASSGRRREGGERRETAGPESPGCPAAGRCLSRLACHRRPGARRCRREVDRGQLQVQDDRAGGGGEPDLSAPLVEAGEHQAGKGRSSSIDDAVRRGVDDPIPGDSTVARLARASRESGANGPRARRRRSPPPPGGPAAARRESRRDRTFTISWSAPRLRGRD
jgi:hypothetical protein